ncbi:hypothetical protein BVH03_22060 [Pseudomonas sp. PA15(2017)]|uniref:hypothetical protein n=1 Tax=Pseudomonas sp. PA15(2017) TaxID=1932111 RepID=UPI0009626387|nr:hypothetical protein [Pseudomonas sp. PA15(2017)]OLU22937.1 hypothetical protein BVH03_22060 [Pseudomonas sp. PA15(2017)]
MNYVNNWSRPVTLPLGATSLALDLPDGAYRLTLTDSVAEPTRWEIIGAVVANGTATLQRGREGTLEQNWPAGSVIYNALTAGVLTDLLQAVADLQARVAALEGGGDGHLVTVGDNGFFLGYFLDAQGNQLGSIQPQTVSVPGAGDRQVMAVAFLQGADLFVIGLAGDELPEDALQAVEVEGYGLLQAADATFTPSDDGGQWQWTVTNTGGWVAGDKRRIDIQFGSSSGGNELTDSQGQPLVDSAGNQLTTGETA